MTVDELRSLSELAAAAARAAGTALARREAAWLSIDRNDRRDIKISADRQAESIILGILDRSGLGVLAEESGAKNEGAGTCRWLVDPLDGTFNYVRGIPSACVSIGLLDGPEPVVGVIYDFWQDDLYVGFQGGGATLNGRPIQVSTTGNPADALLCTGLPPRHDFSPDSMAAFGRSLGAWRKVRMIGSAALSLAFVASGRADIYHETAIMSWDVAAGAALVKAAGGGIRRNTEFGQGPMELIAANAGLLAQVADG